MSAAGRQPIDRSVASGDSEAGPSFNVAEALEARGQSVQSLGRFNGHAWLVCWLAAPRAFCWLVAAFACGGGTCGSSRQHVERMPESKLFTEAARASKRAVATLVTPTLSERTAIGRGRVAGCTSKVPCRSPEPRPWTGAL